MRRFLVPLAIVYAVVFVCLAYASAHLGINDLKIDRAIKGDLPYLRDVIEQYWVDNGRVPTEEEWKTVLPGNYVRVLPKDPWHREYVYRLSSSSQRAYQLYSLGHDGVDQAGEGDDVIGPEKQYSCDEYGIDCPPTVLELLAIAMWSAVLTLVLSILAIAVRFTMKLVSGKTA